MSQPSPVMERQEQATRLQFEGEVAGCHLHSWQGRLFLRGPVITQFRAECLQGDAWSPTGLSGAQARGWAEAHGATHSARRAQLRAVSA